jgi:hypothetical protein
MTMTETAISQMYQIKIQLRGAPLPIWRRIQVSGDTRLSQLHYILLIAMGWNGGHLHQFTIGNRTYSDREAQLEDVLDEDQFTLDGLELKEKAKFRYEYDFGDSWEHEILIEKIALPEENVHYPRCLKGVGACPPEDCGGVWGYADFLKAIQDPNHESYEEMLEWVGGEFNPESFDLEVINKDLQYWTTEK